MSLKNDLTKLKIAKSVAERNENRLRGYLRTMIKTFEKATVMDRLIYLFTKRLPETPAQKQAKGKTWTVESYRDWLRY